MIMLVYQRVCIYIYIHISYIYIYTYHIYIYTYHIYIYIHIIYIYTYHIYIYIYISYIYIYISYIYIYISVIWGRLIVGREFQQSHVSCVKIPQNRHLGSTLSPGRKMSQGPRGRIRAQIPAALCGNDRLSLGNSNKIR